jgi:hypothetical protein
MFAQKCKQVSRSKIPSVGCVDATLSNCGKSLKLLIPPCGSDARSGTRGKLRKRRRTTFFAGHGKNSRDVQWEIRSQATRHILSRRACSSTTKWQWGVKFHSIHLLRYSLLPPKTVPREESPTDSELEEEMPQKHLPVERNDGKADRMIMATKLLNQRIKDVMCARRRAGKADITPTLVDLERTHILYVNAHFKPFADIGSTTRSVSV